jgi:hypothetical protein
MARSDLTLAGDLGADLVDSAPSIREAQYDVAGVEQAHRADVVRYSRPNAPERRSSATRSTGEQGGTGRIRVFTSPLDGQHDRRRYGAIEKEPP